MIEKLIIIGAIAILGAVSASGEAIASTPLSSKNYIYWAPLKAQSHLSVTTRAGKSGQPALPFRPQLPIKSISSQLKPALFSQKSSPDNEQMQGYDVLWLDFPVLVGKDIHKPVRTTNRTSL